MTDQWKVLTGEDAPDVTGARVYTESGPVLGGRWHVLPSGEVWHELAGGGYQRSVYRPDTFTGPAWVPAAG